MTKPRLRIEPAPASGVNDEALLSGELAVWLGHLAAENRSPRTLGRSLDHVKRLHD